MSTERVFVIGGTGNIGTKCVQDLLTKNISVTLFARDPKKVDALFPSNDLVQTIQGDINNIEQLKEHFKGHTRLFLLIGDNTLTTNDTRKSIEIRVNIAKYAYDAGIQQIVSLSAFMVNMGYRTSFIGAAECYADKTIYEYPQRGYFVTLRPSRFMSNSLRQSHAIKNRQTYYDNVEPDRKRGWISTNDIGAVAAVALSEDVKKHGDAVYNLTGQVLTNQQVVEAFSNVLGKEIKYQQISHLQLYKMMTSHGFPHLTALDFCDNLESDDCDKVNPAIEILLERQPETLEQYIGSQKALYF